MKNRYLKGSHISETKFKVVIRHFALDLNGMQIAELSGLNKNTVTRILNLVRERIKALAQAESVFSAGEIEVDESYFGARRVKGKRGRGAQGKTAVFGMKKRGDKVYTQVVKNCSAAALVPIIKGLAPDQSVIYSDEWRAYDGLVDAGYKQHHRVKHSQGVYAEGKAHINGIENFWGIAKTRLAKLRGIKRETFHLHLKETEWRFNHRQENLCVLLLNEFKRNPL